MKVNLGIACGFHKDRKETLARFCENASIELYSMRPLTKCAADWKNGLLPNMFKNN